MAGNHPPKRARPTQDRTGWKYGLLTVLRYAGGSRWECLCVCGSVVAIPSCNLSAGNTKSCGCSKGALITQRKTTHGYALRSDGRQSVEYTTWQSIRQRCCRKGNRSYPDYGGRGIKVCDRWLNSFEAFLEDMGRRPSPDHSIDRIDGEKGYEPGNCKWATRDEQNNNKRNNRRISWNGQTRTLAQWCKALGLTRGAVNARLEAGWTVDEALGTPIRPSYRTKHVKPMES